MMVHRAFVQLTRRGATRLWLATVAAVLALGSGMAAEGSPPVPSGWVTPRSHGRMAPHPRLFVSAEQINRMVSGRGAGFSNSYAQVAAAAESGVRDAVEPLRGQGELHRSFLMLGRVASLAVQWHRTREPRYLEAAVTNCEAMRNWIQPEGPIDLWQGQNLAALAIAHDLLSNDLTPAQRERLVAVARHPCVPAFLRVTGNREHPAVPGEHGSWWQGSVINWNPVCCVGAGMLALTMYEDLPEAQTVIDRVNASLRPVLDRLNETGGGWYEGLGYWNWTMHYLSLYGVSHERATGQPLGGFHSAGFREGLLFGPHFVPYDEACGFGDNQHGRIDASLRLAAEFLGDLDALRQLQDYQARFERTESVRRERRRGHEATGGTRVPAPATDIGYGVPLALLVDPDPETSGPPPKREASVVRSYPNPGWAMIADQWPAPNVYASVRMGPLGGPGSHAHHDLLSWNGLVGMERMILSYNQAGYYPPAFAGRAWEIYERSPMAKNTIFVAGLPPANPRSGMAHAAESRFQLPAGPALRIDASSAYRLGHGAARVYRLFTVLGDRGLLVLDRVETRAANPVEVRAHTDKEAAFATNDVVLTGSCETARMTFASDRPAVLRRASALLTNPRAVPPTVMRWQTLDPVAAVTMASLLTRGSSPVTLSLVPRDRTVEVVATGEGWTNGFILSSQLQPLEPASPDAGANGNGGIQK